MKWYFIRHGDMAGDAHARMQPPVHGCLSHAGQAQVARLAGQLAPLVFDEIFASPLGRALQTAQALTRAAGADIRVREWLVEWQPAASVQSHEASTRFEDLLHRDGQLHPEQSWKTPAGEGALEMAARIVPGWIADLRSLGVHAGHGGYLLDDPDDQRQLAWVAHGGSLGLLLAFVLGIAFQPYPPLQFAQCGLAVVTLTRRLDVWYPSLEIGSPGGGA